jgi:EpsI family protein
LPLVIGSWIGQELPVEGYVKAILETDDVIQRNYVNRLNNKTPIQLAVVFSSDNRRAAHPPEVCYRGTGWEVTDKKIIEPEGLPPMVRLILDGGGGKRDMVIYFYRAGTRITANYYRQQYNIVVNHLLRRAASSALVRFSSPIVRSEGDTERDLADFIRLMLPEIKSHLND